MKAVKKRNSISFWPWGGTRTCVGKEREETRQRLKSPRDDAVSQKSDLIPPRLAPFHNRGIIYSVNPTPDYQPPLSIGINLSLTHFSFFTVLPIAGNLLTLPCCC